MRDTLRSPFAILSGLFAQMFIMARLLPPTHPYAQDHQFGTFGMLDVIRAAGAHLKFTLKTIDQVIVFFSIIAAYVCFIALIVMATLYIIFPPAQAALTESKGLLSTSELIGSIYSYTKTEHPEKDIALTLLDRTLGITGPTPSGTFFGSDTPYHCPGGKLGESDCSGISPYPSPFHVALHSLLEFFSFVVFAFAILYFIYLVSSVVIETAMTGKPAGARIDKFWGPLRLVAAIGMLVPLSPHNLNTAQYIVLYTAKMSSAFATNGWLYYNSLVAKNSIDGTLESSNPIGMDKFNYRPATGPSIDQSSPLAAKLGAPNMAGLVQFLQLVTTCEYYYERTQPGVNVSGYFVNTELPTKAAYIERTSGKEWLEMTEEEQVAERNRFVTYEEALKFFNYKNIRLTFGIYDPVKYPNYTGGVAPVCGELTIPVTSVDDPDTPIIENPGAEAANKLYYQYVIGLLDNTTYPRQLMDGFAYIMIENYAKVDNLGKCAWDTDEDGFLNHPVAGTNLPELGPCSGDEKDGPLDPPKEYMKYQVELFQSVFQSLINSANYQLADPKNFSIDREILDRGWAGAGAWYQKVAAINGNYVVTVRNIPYGSRMPLSLRGLNAVQAAITPNMTNSLEMISTLGEPVSELNTQDKKAAEVLKKTQSVMGRDDCKHSFIPDPKGTPGVSNLPGFEINDVSCKTDNIFMGAVNALVGTQFIFQFNKNNDVHPLTQLVTFGRTLLEATGANLLNGSGIAVAGGIVSVGNADLGGSLKKISGFFLTVASTMFTAGFMLFYVLPMLPFIYFFFAMLSWVKAIFEALIGAPLWAMAHLSLKGGGFPSGMARGGYLLLMEIFLRPIITVFALIIAMGTFTATVYFLNDVFSIFLNNIGRESLVQKIAEGKDISGLQDVMEVFFFSIMYIMFIYILANSSFQIIDKIPNGFMRWFGAGAKSFASQAHSRDAPSKTFTSNIFIAVGNPARGMIDQLDERAFEIANATTKIADENSGHQIKQSIQDALGKDRQTRIVESIRGGEGKGIGDMTGDYANAAKEVKKIKAKMDNTSSAPEKKQLEVMMKQQEIIKQINDPVLLYKEMMEPGKSGMSDEARELARENIEKMKELVKKVRPLIYDVSVDQAGGSYIDPEKVDKAVEQYIQSTRNQIVKELSK